MRIIPTCHPEKKHNARGLCSYCYKKWLYANSDKARRSAIRSSQRSYKKNRDEVLMKQRERYANNSNSASNAYAYRIARKFGITYQDYMDMLEKQNNKCAICETDMSIKKLVIDHDHKTGKIRGLLCNPCNTAIGSLGDSLKNINNAAKFLKACGVTE